MCTPFVLGEDERLDEINAQLRLIQKKNGLTFGTDAYLLSAFVRPAPHDRAVDLGSGTGVIPLLLTARQKIAYACAIEIQPAFAALIARNVALNDLTDRITPLCADVREVCPQQLPWAKEADIVTANPPYMRTDSGARNRADEKYIARHEVAGGIDDFCAAAARLLRSGGLFYSVWRPDRLSALMASMARHRLEPKRMVFVHADEQSEPSMVLTEARLDGAPSLKILPPLFLHSSESRGDRSRPLTPRAQSIYDSMRFCE
ncbi:MAG: methyltransferase [Clostridia bacterium]|nr:methyltransferase [Clostridia bacterium]